MSSNELNDYTETAEEACLGRHKKERKELQAEIQKLKNSISKGDKKKKKEVTTQIALLEQQLDQKHEEELKAVRETSENENISDLSDLKIKDQSESNEGDDPISEQTRISKSQKRKAKKAQKDAEASERIRIGEIASIFSERRIEEDKFQRILDNRGFKMCQIPSNGDCLYASFVHQLSQQGIDSTVVGLRRQAANYMRQNLDELLPFLVKEETGDLYTEDEYLDYCNKVESTPEWGGQTELKALSDTLQACVEVIQAEGPIILIGNQYEDNKKITVTYHRHAYGLGEHYNSVELIGEVHPNEF